VHYDRLYVGRTQSERSLIGEQIRTDLHGFLARIQNGFFNAVINDYERGETHLCNDWYGGLPLYVAQQADRIVFAATYAGLREQGFTDQQIDRCIGSAINWARAQR
jgi:hypothetical protein